MNARTALRLVVEASDPIKPAPKGHFSKRQLEKGTTTELEHTRSRKLARRIAKQHLGEVPDYYDLLDKYVETPRHKRKLTRTKAGLMMALPRSSSAPSSP